MSGNDGRITVSTYAEEVARILLNIGAVTCRLDDPFVFTSGWRSPIYVNTRKVISYTAERRRISQLAAQFLENHIDLDSFAYLAGGESAGIPFCAWLCEILDKRMLYIRKKPKEFGQKKQIEGDLEPNSGVILIEDLISDGNSKQEFVGAIRRQNAMVNHVFVIFAYNIFPGLSDTLRRNHLALFALTDWSALLDVGAAMNYFSSAEVDGLREYARHPTKA